MVALLGVGVSAGPGGGKPSESRLGNLVRWWLHEQSAVRREALLESMNRATGNDVMKVAAAIRDGEHQRFPKEPAFGSGARLVPFRDQGPMIVPMAGAADDVADLILPAGYDPGVAHPLVLELGSTNLLVPKGAVLVRIWTGSDRRVREAWHVEALVLSVLARVGEIVNIDTDRVFLRGERDDAFQDYAQLAWFVALHNPDRFAGLLAMQGVWREGIVLAPNAAYFDAIGIESRFGDPYYRRFMKELEKFRNGHRFLSAPRDQGLDAYLLKPIRTWWKQGMRERDVRSIHLVADRVRPVRAFWLGMQPKDLGESERTIGRVLKYKALHQPAWIRAVLVDSSTNSVTVQADGVNAFDLHISPEMFDPNLPVRVYLFKGDRPFRLSPVDAMLPLRVDLFYRERLWRNSADPDTLEVTCKDQSHFFLLKGRAQFDLPAGDYRVEAYRGLFYEPFQHEFTLAAGKPLTVTLAMRNWLG